MKLNSKQLRHMSDEEIQHFSDNLKRSDIYIVLDDILDTYNIGGFFRLADAIGAKKIYLCGRTETPPNTKIKKSSIGTYKVVPWEYKETAKEAIADLRKISDMKVVAIEQCDYSIDYRKFKYQEPIAFVMGNENFGMEEKTIKLVDEVLEIPMHGLNNSLNVMVAAGIVFHEALNKLGK